MSIVAASYDRRREERHPEPGQVRWQRENDPKTYEGWLSDRAASSISFITNDRRPPSMGEVVELRMLDRSRLKFRVVRTTEYDGASRYVACRKIDA